mmetsp:Transcript_16514/g.52614  ORF Transcript_16514/g.52614 Transcript_16514/m.52614 type:complete len:230 (+) Transcript_16514:620-1309(+)
MTMREVPRRWARRRRRRRPRAVAAATGRRRRMPAPVGVVPALLLLQQTIATALCACVTARGTFSTPAARCRRLVDACAAPCAAPFTAGPRARSLPAAWWSRATPPAERSCPAMAGTVWCRLCTHSPPACKAQSTPTQARPSLAPHAAPSCRTPPKAAKCCACCAPPLAAASSSASAAPSPPESTTASSGPACTTRLTSLGAPPTTGTLMPPTCRAPRTSWQRLVSLPRL